MPITHKYHFVRDDLLAKGQAEVRWVPTDDMVADIPTKALPFEKHWKFPHASTLMLASPFSFPQSFIIRAAEVLTLCLPLEAMTPWQTAKQADEIYTSATKEHQHRITIVLQVLLTHQKTWNCTECPDAVLPVQPVVVAVWHLYY
ncbi:hypothetical protein C8Q76DRAFT_688004 [Earliella scabrosa]|nr:hypothetical protein C8Q76DRAFT_688004 [Earliella scabrosa]